jgi:hypothetical protein
MKTLHKSSIALIFFLLAVPVAHVHAGRIEASTVVGNTYTCYVFSPLDIVNTDITFRPKGGLLFSAYEGNGFYFSLLNTFSAGYWSLKQRIGTKPQGDYLFFFSGALTDPFIWGAGIIVYEYKEVYGMSFFGFRDVEADQEQNF